MLNNIENFRAINGYDNYEISNHGRVRNVNSRYILKNSISGKGYKMVGLTLNGKRKTKSIHRLIAEAFIDNPNNYKCIDHIDRNKLNNELTNLRWATYKMNNCNRTSRGSINFAGVSYEKKYNRYIASVQNNNGVKIRKHFSMSCYGVNALELAKEWRINECSKYEHYL